MRIQFNRPSLGELERQYVNDALDSHHLSGDGKYTKRVYRQMQELLGIDQMLLTTSGTDALELASLLACLQPGDEVITPSFTFSSTANAFMLRGAVPVFCDIRPDTCNLDETKIEPLITEKTKAIYAVDYAGVPPEMDVINEIAARHHLMVIEDAAQAVGSTYRGRPAGTLTDLGCFSFHETKNYSMGEGGAIVINNEPALYERAEIIREKGTNRCQLLRGQVDKYTWHDIGSSFLPSDLLAAILSAQLERFDEIMEKRLAVWNTYHNGLIDLEDAGKLRRPIVPPHVRHNAHLYYILLPSEDVRTYLSAKLIEKEIYAYIHYIPLHSAPYGLAQGCEPLDCPVTEDIAARLLRLPLHAEMSETDAETVIREIKLALS